MFYQQDERTSDEAEQCERSRSSAPQSPTETSTSTKVGKKNCSLAAFQTHGKERPASAPYCVSIIFRSCFLFRVQSPTTVQRHSSLWSSTFSPQSELSNKLDFSPFSFLFTRRNRTEPSIKKNDYNILYVLQFRKYPISSWYRSDSASLPPP